MEAVIAAVYLDGGDGKAFRLVRRALGDRLDDDDPDALDAKTRLQEVLQVDGGEAPVYRKLTGSDGPAPSAGVPHARIGQDRRNWAAAAAKRQAQRYAARDALKKLRKNDPADYAGRAGRAPAKGQPLRQKLEIQGFKSFADKTRQTFDGHHRHRGPNGCGKSDYLRRRCAGYWANRAPRRCAAARWRTSYLAARKSAVFLVAKVTDHRKRGPGAAAHRLRRGRRHPPGIPGRRQRIPDQPHALPAARRGRSVPRCSIGREGVLFDRPGAASTRSCRANRTTAAASSRKRRASRTRPARPRPKSASEIPTRTWTGWTTSCGVSARLEPSPPKVRRRGIPDALGRLPGAGPSAFLVRSDRLSRRSPRLAQTHAALLSALEEAAPAPAGAGRGPQAREGHRALGQPARR